MRRIHEAFLRGCRSVDAALWNGGPQALLSVVLPVPPSSLLPGGREIAEALARLESQARTVPLDESVIRAYHRMVLPSSKAAYRKGEMTLVGSPLRPPPAARVPASMGALSTRLRELQAGWDARPPSEPRVLEESARLYHDLGVIHPFSDGNGRTARLAMNHLVRRYLDAYVILPSLAVDPMLLRALEEANRGDFDGLCVRIRAGLRRL